MVSLVSEQVGLWDPVKNKEHVVGQEYVLQSRENHQSWAKSQISDWITIIKIVMQEGNDSVGKDDCYVADGHNVA